MHVIASAYPNEIGERYLELLVEWRPTVFDARRLLSPWRDRMIRVVVDDGQFGLSPLGGMYHDVVNSPRFGYGLVLRNLSQELDPVRRKNLSTRKKRTMLPISLAIELPACFEFLRQPGAKWPLPAKRATCSLPSCGFEANVGRYCIKCGHFIHRRVPSEYSAKYLGPSFSALQRALRERVGYADARVVECNCGGMLWCGDRYCSKCGRPTENRSRYAAFSWDNL